MPDKPEITSKKANGAPSDRSSRPEELEDFLNRFVFHPLAWRIALGLRHSFITPNQVSVTGGMLVIAAATLYFYAETAWHIAIAFTLHLSWHVLDGADGDLARMTGRTSRQGEIVDGICDYVSHIILYCALAWILTSQIGWTAWLWAVAAGAARIVQAVFYENQRRQYQFWVYDAPWLRVSKSQTKTSLSWIETAGHWYAQFGSWMTPAGTRIDSMFTKLDPSHKSRLRALIKDVYAPVLRQITPLNANYRTVAIGLSMFAGSPLYAFAFEAVFLSVWMAISIPVAKRACTQIVDQASATISR
ncbi:MAG: CDP-alcohol phosphatidyltransferase family protein [Pseudomonadota bacterium]